MSALSREPWTFCCAWVLPGIAIFMVNIPCAGGRTTRTLVGYDDAHPVRITEAS